MPKVAKGPGPLGMEEFCTIRVHDFALENARELEYAGGNPLPGKCVRITATQKLNLQDLMLLVGGGDCYVSCVAIGKKKWWGRLWGKEPELAHADVEDSRAAHIAPVYVLGTPMRSILAATAELHQGESIELYLTPSWSTQWQRFAVYNTRLGSWATAAHQAPRLYHAQDPQAPFTVELTSTEKIPDEVGIHWDALYSGCKLSTLRIRAKHGEKIDMRRLVVGMQTHGKPRGFYPVETQLQGGDGSAYIEENKNIGGFYALKHCMATDMLKVLLRKGAPASSALTIKLAPQAEGEDEDPHARIDAVFVYDPVERVMVQAENTTPGYGQERSAGPKATRE